MGKRTHIGTYRHGHAMSELKVKLLHVIVEELVLLRRLFGGFVGGKILLNGERRNGVDSPLMRQAHRFVAGLVSMVDGSYARLGGVQRYRLTFAMHRDAGLQARCLGDSLRQLRFGVLEDGVKLAVLEEVAAGFVDFVKSAPSLICWRITATSSSPVLA